MLPSIEAVSPVELDQVGIRYVAIERIAPDKPPTLRAAFVAQGVRDGKPMVATETVTLGMADLEKFLAERQAARDGLSAFLTALLSYARAEGRI